MEMKLIWEYVMSEERVAHVCAWHRAQTSLADYDRMTRQNSMIQEEL